MMVDELTLDETEEASIPPIDEAAESEQARRVAAQRTARGVLKRTPEPLQDAMMIENAAEYDALTPGTRFKHVDDPATERRKPWSVSSPEEYADVPEGEHFTDPNGELRQKPKYEPLNFTSQTLYNMAVNDKERRNALERSYPGQVKEAEGTGELYVDDEGVLRKSKGALSGGMPAFLAKEALPVIGSVGGEIGGGILGIAGGPPGVLAGAIAGGGAGGAAGQGLNDLILQIAGIYDRTGGEQAGALAAAGAGGAVGTAVGRGIAWAAPVAKDWLLRDSAARVGKFLGVNPEGLATAVRMREAGLELVPPSMWAPESPHLINMAQVFDPAFRTQKPLVQAAEQFADQEFKKILEAAGIKYEGSLVKPTVAPSTAKAEEAIMARRAEASKAADADLSDALLLREIQVRTEGVASEANKIALDRAARQAKEAADAMVDAAFKGIQRDIDNAMAAAKAKTNSGELWWTAGENLKMVNAAVRDRASKMFKDGQIAAGDIKPDVTGLSEAADRFIRQLPDGFENMHPTFVRQLRNMAGEVGPDGAVIKPPVEPTWVQLAELQQELRSNYNYYDLAPSIKQGTFKNFSGKISDILHSADNISELQEASRLWQLAGTFYRENVVPLSHAQFQLVSAGLKAGFAADPKVLFNTLVKDGQSDLIRSLENIVGPSTWNAIKAADRQLVMDLSKSKSFLPGEIDAQQYVAQILERHRNGMLESVHGKDVTARLIELAQTVQALRGELPINVLQNDTIKDVITKAHLAAQAAEATAKKDPLAALEKEMDGIRKRHKAEIGKLRGNDPLRDIYSPTVAANKAAEKILGDENLLLAAGARFGENSDTFNILFQTWLTRVLRGTTNPGKASQGTKGEGGLFNVSPEVQELMARKTGMSVESLINIFKDFDFLMSSQAAKNVGVSMQAGSKVSTPWSSIVWKGHGGIPILGADTAGRSILRAYYKLATVGLNNFTFLRWLEKGLKGDPAARELTRKTVQRMMNRGGVVGAASGAAAAQANLEPEELTAEPPVPTPGPMQASDGKWYVPHPTSPGKFIPME